MFLCIVQFVNINMLSREKKNSLYIHFFLQWNVLLIEAKWLALPIKDCICNNYSWVWSKFRHKGFVCVSVFFFCPFISLFKTCTGVGKWKSWDDVLLIDTWYIAGIIRNGITFMLILEARHHSSFIQTWLTTYKKQNFERHMFKE